MKTQTTNSETSIYKSGYDDYFFHQRYKEHCSILSEELEIATIQIEYKEWEDASKTLASMDEHTLDFLTENHNYNYTLSRDWDEIQQEYKDYLIQFLQYCFWCKAGVDCMIKDLYITADYSFNKANLYLVNATYHLTMANTLIDNLY